MWKNWVMFHQSPNLQSNFFWKYSTRYKLLIYLALHSSCHCLLTWKFVWRGVMWPYWAAVDSSSACVAVDAELSLAAQAFCNVPLVCFTLQNYLFNIPFIMSLSALFTEWALIYFTFFQTKSVSSLHRTCTTSNHISNFYFQYHQRFTLIHLRISNIFFECYD